MLRGSISCQAMTGHLLERSRYISIKAPTVKDIGESAEKHLNHLIESSCTPRHILFHNVIPITPKIRKICQKIGSTVCSYELGWFPHRKTWHFDPLGFSNHSLLSQSRLDDIDIDLDRCMIDIEEYKKKWMIQRRMTNHKKFILVVLQKTSDSTIQYGYPDFNGWESIVELAKRWRKKNEHIVVKTHPMGSKLDIKDSKNIHIVSHMKCNIDLLKRASLVIGVNSTMLYEASLLYNKPVFALGDSWFDSHPEVVTKIDIYDDRPQQTIVTQDDILYRTKMFLIMRSMQMNLSQNRDDSIRDFSQKVDMVSQVQNINDWITME